MRSLVALLVSVAVAATAVACTSAGGSGGTIEGIRWVLKTYDVSGTATQVPSGTIVDAMFTSGKVAGSAGCNLYNASVTITGSSIKVGQATTTQKACEPAVTEVEQAYLANLAAAATFSATKDSLTIFNSAAKQILVYAAGPANALEGSWSVTGYNNGKGGVVSPIIGTTLTADFAADRVSGSGGCNTYGGPYTLTGSTVKIGPLGSTKMACPDQAASDQEAQFLAALENSTTFSQTGATLTLKAADGANQVTLTGK